MYAWQDGITALIWAARAGSAEIVQMLLGADGIDVNVQNEVACAGLVWLMLRGEDERG